MEPFSDLTQTPTIDLPRGNRTRGEVMSLVRKHFPKATHVAFEKGKVVIYFAPPPPRKAVSFEEAQAMASSLLAEHLKDLREIRDQAG